MSENPEPEKPIIPSLNAKVSEAALRLAQQVVDQHQARMQEIVSQVDDTMIRHVQASASAAQKIMDSYAAAQAKQTVDLSWVTKVMDDHNQMMVNRNRLLLDIIAESVRPPQIFEAAGTVRVVSGTSGSAELVGHGQLEAEGSVGGMPSDIAPARKSLTREQWFALVMALASLHSYAMDLRHGDKADQGTLLLIIAALMIVWAMQPTDDD